MMYDHWSDFDGSWRWDNFTPEELSCPCCGEYWHCEQTLDQAQAARDEYGSSLAINSAHRCRKHNRKVGGALNSEHLRIALDISIRGKSEDNILDALKVAGFTTFGLYNSFIHTDIRPNRRWYGKGAKAKWTA